MELMEAKFQAENQILNDEFLFLTTELDKLRLAAARTTPDPQDDREKPAEGVELRRELEGNVAQLKQELARVVG